MMDDDKFEGEKDSPQEQPVYQLITNVEEASQRRPVVRFGAVVLAVGIGSYFGVGRHVKTLIKDVRVIEAFLADDLERRRHQAAAIYAAIERGQEFTFFPGLGVVYDVKSIPSK